MVSALWLVVCALVIYLSCEWFVNAIEWLGQRLNVGALAVGTVLAAFGTALPESTVTFVAVVSGSAEQKSLGIGAAMGGPLALGTVAYAVIGFLLLRRRHAAAVPAGERAAVPAGEPAAAAPPVGDEPDVGDLDKLARDQRWFLVVFVVKVALGLVTFALKPWLGLLFFVVYAVYFGREVRGGRSDGPAADLDPLRLQPRRRHPQTWAVVVQTGVALGLIFVASKLFVQSLEAVGPMLGLSATVTALLLAPIATELPEVMNAVIWVRQGKTPLALANISGAMMIQATVPSGLGLLFTPWRFDAPLLLAGLVTMVAIGFLLAMLGLGRFGARSLAAVGVLYLVFAAALFAVLTAG